jgi:hypothetical protein
MMKKFYVILVVLAMVGISSIALAADVSVGGTVQIRSRNFDTLSLDKTTKANTVDTQERVMVDVNAKSGDIKSKISIWNDFENWGRFESTQGSASLQTGSTATHTHTYNSNTIGIREAWILFPVADTGFFIKGGHQLLQLGNGLFFRSQHFGSDAWVAFRDDGPNHLGFVNVKVSEGSTSKSDDVDAYVIVDTFKISEAAKLGIDITMANDRKNALGFAGGPVGSGDETQAQNVGLNYTGKIGPMNLKAQVDLQMGKAAKANPSGSDKKLKGNEVYVRGDVAMDPAAVNFTVARGSGLSSAKAASGTFDYEQFVTFLDIDPHYTFLYEYKIANPSPGCGTLSAGKNAGFCNTTALNAGAKFAATKNLSIGADLWFLQFTEKVTNKKTAGGSDTNDLGSEVDVKISWKLGESLVWNWDLGYFTPGAGMGKDVATGIQGILAYTF